jgi:hypothetical protein
MKELNDFEEFVKLVKALSDDEFNTVRAVKKSGKIIFFVGNKPICCLGETLIRTCVEFLDMQFDLKATK